MSTASTAIALNRFGLGARPDEPAPSDPRAWLLAQIGDYDARPAAWEPLQRTPALMQDRVAQQLALRAAPEAERAALRSEHQRLAREVNLAAVGARANSALLTAAPFMERMVHFWANHFAVSVDKDSVISLAGGFEADAIRPHVLGSFEDLLVAVVRHPAMLVYLDQARSTGPNSQVGKRQRNRPGLNENLAREILELHTLGVRSGYTQDDVTELARALTGWTLPNEAVFDGAMASFRYVARQHEPGVRKVLGRSYADDGEAQARAILHDLALAPATARHIAAKLARHVVADDPPARLVQRLERAFLDSGGDLAVVYRVLVTAPEAWQPDARKFKSPWEWSISGLRALGRRDVPAGQINNLMNQLGQPVWRPGSPAGYADTAAAWAAPDALLRRVEVAQRLAEQAGRHVDARALAPQVLPGALSEATGRAIGAAETPATALALLLASPDFLRR